LLLDFFEINFVARFGKMMSPRFGVNRYHSINCCVELARIGMNKQPAK